ncbi:MAG: UvrD-helicase domain-containing protein [Spirochaetales bacterium]|nr:UvrD-helicase domain-containing protein [Spirochaetales bacterium]
MTFEQIMENEKFFPNPEQRLVIESTKNTVVSAGAGAGKTAVLSWRFLRLVMESHVKPEEILTLTFTKKAASEMRERIYSRLMKAKDSLPEDTLKSFGRATISTMDSFFAQIVRSDSISYSLPRDISVMTEDELEDLSERLAVRFLASPDCADEVRAIASLLMPSEIMENFFIDAAKNITITGEYDSVLISQRFHEEICRVYEKRRQILGTTLEILGKLNLKGSLKEQYERLCSLFDSESLSEDDYFRLPSKCDPEIKEIVTDLIPVAGNGSGYSVLQDLAKSPISVSRLQTAIEKFAGMLNSEKRRLGKLTFNDVVGIALCALRDNLELRAVFKNRFRFIMIDEFQDNNSVQRDLLYLLAEKRSLKGVAGRIPTVDELESDKLFFVGDEKQSIYRFRGADVSVFRHLQEEIGRNGSSLKLSTNYRSNPALINHFNEVFSSILSESDQDYDARYEPINAGRAVSDDRCRIEFAVYDKADIQDPEMDAGLLEAEAIGDYCNRILNTDDFLVDGERPKPSDIAILFRSGTNQMNIEKSLKRRGIEYQIAETRSLMLDAVASDFYRFLNCILYPYDRRSLIALLKSPFCGLCDRSIDNVIKGSDPLEVDKSRYEHLCSFLDRMRDQAFRMTIPEVLETLYIDGGYKAFLDRSKDSQTFTEHYEYLFSYAISYETEGRSLSDYARFIRDYLGTSKKLPDTEVLHKDRSGVQIMTVHKSKGLEFKVVIFCGTGSKPQNDKGSIVFKYNDDLVASENKSILKILEDDRKAKEQAELRRLMYVAFTRAKDHLIVMGGYEITSKGNMSTADVFKWYSAVTGFDRTSKTCLCPDVTVRDISQTQLKGQLPGHEEIGFVRVPIMEFQSRSKRVSVTGSKSHFDTNDDLKSSKMLTNLEVDSIIRSLNANDKFGTLCHLILENQVKGRPVDGIECHISDKDSENRQILDAAKELASSFFESELYKNYVSGHETRPELRFYAPDADDPDLAVEGVMDLLVRGDEYNLVIDYKTDLVMDPELHRSQVLTYIKVAKDLFGKRCYGTLFYLRDGSSPGFWDEDGNLLKSI